MFGISKAPDLLGTRDIEACLNSLLIDIDENDEVWIITPYATMGKLSTQRRSIAEAAKRKARISFVVRNEDDQVKPILVDLSEAISNGLKVYSFNRLHAKVYWFERTACIVTSANLIDGSFEQSTEIGIVIDAGNKLHSEIRNWIKEIIEPEIVCISNPVKIIQQSKIIESGHCIRCNKSINLNILKPYCVDHFKIWEKYSNPEYGEKFCHRCGKEFSVNMARPLCMQCFKILK